MKPGIIKLSCPHCSGGVVPVLDKILANYQCQNPECGQVVNVRDIKFENVDTIGASTMTDIQTEVDLSFGCPPEMFA